LGHARRGRRSIYDEPYRAAAGLHPLTASRSMMVRCMCFPDR
jgi:hypothetical protein